MRKSHESVSLTVMIIMVVNLRMSINLVRFMKQLESTLSCEFTKHTGMHKFPDEPRASSINCQ